MADGSSHAPQQPALTGLETDDDDDEDDRYCMPTKTIFDKLMIVALLCVFIGLTLSTFGYLIPNQYAFNPDLPAREMESIEVRHANLTETLNACIRAGMSFVAIGGLLTMAVFTSTVIFGDCDCMRNKDTGGLSQRSSPNSRQYGSVLMGEMFKSKINSLPNPKKIHNLSSFLRFSNTIRQAKSDL